MDFFTILAQTTTTTAEAGGEGLVPIDKFWDTITSLGWLEAFMFVSFGSVCLFYGWRVFKILVVICFGLVGLALGITVTNKIIGPTNEVLGGIACMVLFAFLSVPLMRWAVCILGAIAGGILTAGIWYASGLNEQYIWAGALVGIVAGGMISFIIFRVAVILFTSLGGSSLVIVGMLAILYLYPQTSGTVHSLVYAKKWFLPASITALTALGVVLQHRFVKNSKEWNI
jgi:hypothetical protein